MSGTILRRLVTVPAALVLIVVTVALARLVAVTTPIGSEHSRPWIHSGLMNQPIVEDDFEVTVLSVRGGRAHEDSLGTAATDGVFLLVRLRLVVFDAPTSLGFAEVVDATGNAFEAHRFVDGSLAGHALDPGIPIEGEVVFEVPQASATQLVLHVTSSRGPWGDYNVVVEVPLEISAEDVRDWYANGFPLALKQPEVVR